MGTAINVFSMEDIGNLCRKPLTEKYTSQNEIISVLNNELWHIANLCFPLRRAYLFNLLLSHHLLIQAPTWRALLSFLV